MQEYRIKANEAKQRLIQGNRRFMEMRELTCNVSPETLLHFSENGQQPYAIIVTCSDSRVVPELIFSAGIGDLFVIRVAGNVIDAHQLGSIEYAAEHLGTGLIVVLGHDHCGAVHAAVAHEPDGYIKFITDEIRRAVGDETDEYRACCLNVRHSCEVIEQSLLIRRDEQQFGLQVLGAVYHLQDGHVAFL